MRVRGANVDWYLWLNAKETLSEPQF
jgi:hypothetical protein